MQMSEQELLELYDKMKERWGQELPDPVHEPIRFQYYMKLYYYYKDKI